MLPLSGTKRVWMPDEVEAYIEVEVREVNGDKATVETKDGRVSSPPGPLLVSLLPRINRC